MTRRLIFVVGVFLFTLPFIIGGSFVSVKANQHLFLRNVDFDSLLEDDDWEWNESWFMPIAMLRAPSLTSNYVTVFARIQGKGFIKHSIETYSLSLLNPNTGAVLFSSPFVFAKSPQVLEFTLELPQAVADSVFELRINHFSKLVPYEALENSPVVNRVDGTKIPEDEGLRVFASAKVPAAAVTNTTCAVEAKDGKTYMAVLSTRERDARTVVAAAAVSPTFPSRWVNSFDGSLVHDPVASQALSPLKTVQLLRAITRFADGTVGNVIWTGSYAQGQFSPFNCNGWTSMSSNVTGAIGYALHGKIDWFGYQELLKDCSSKYGVLCLEKADLQAQRTENLSRMLRGDPLIYSP